MNSGELRFAISSWRRVLGHEQVIIDRETIGPSERTTFRTEQSIRAILRPSDKGQVQACLRIATQNSIAVYPTSRGRNWGLGAKVPIESGAVLLDLSRMDQIVDYDDAMGTITVQPGVTFQQVASFLGERGSQRYLAMIGGPPDASLIGNAVERGDGVGPLGERFSHFADAQVVLPTGECLRTGFGRLEGARARALHRWGVGPSLDGLFSQSNLGVVTEATIWLAERPSHFQAYLFAIRHADGLRQTCDRVKRLMAQGIIAPNSLAIWNHYKLAASEGQFPWRLTGGRKPLQAADLQQLHLPFGGAQWVGVGGLYSPSSAHAKADRTALKHGLRGSVDPLVVLDRLKARMLGLFHAPLKRWARIDVRSLMTSLVHESVFLGYPTHKSTNGVYWRKRTPVPAAPDPERDQCGLLWLCPAVPFDPDAITQAIDIAEQCCMEFGFEPNIALTFPSERCVYVLPSIVFDRDDTEEDSKALDCHDRMHTALMAAGFYCHRLGVRSMTQLPRSQLDYDAVLGRLKHAVDPGGVLAPGRYDATMTKGAVGGTSR